jgi:tRNA-splicing ligase RtcB
LNHFWELQEDLETGEACIMLHSGSRHLGYAVCDYYNKLARELNTKWLSSVPDEWELAFLPTDTREGQSYLWWMNVALDFAKENRDRMLYDSMDIVKNMVKKYANEDVHYDMDQYINVHHNYAAMENHFDSNVLVHRKGAIRVRKDEMAVIPGAMGSFSYVVKGLGNAQTFCSASHGAGRVLGRKEAMRQFSVEDVVKDLDKRGVILGKSNRGDIAEECPWAYKDIDQVIENESDLVTVQRKLKTVAVIKG